MRTAKYNARPSDSSVQTVSIIDLFEVHLRTLLLVTFIVSLLTPVFAQEAKKPDSVTVYYNKAVRLTDSTVIIGQVQYDPATDRYEIKPRTGGIISVLNRKVHHVEHHARTFLPPTYNLDPCFGCIIPCEDRQRDKQWYFLELRGWGMYSGTDESKYSIGLDDLTIGGDGALGIRFGQFGFGFGSGYFKGNDIQRIPLYAHFRYNLSPYCFSPFLYGQLGTVFDNQSGEKITTDKILHPGPKIAGFGVGFDYALVSWFDVSADIGYRYMQLPTKTDCDCSDDPEPRSAIFHNETHSVILRVGVTF